MSIRYKCEECGSVLKVKDELAGTKGKCPKCKTRFVVPELDEAEVSEPPKADAPQEESQETAADEEFDPTDVLFGVDDSPSDQKASNVAVGIFEDDEDVTS